MTTPNPPIPGHHLLNEGHVFRTHEEDRFPAAAAMIGGDVYKYSGGCQCGALPAEFPNVSANQMKAWHRRHKEAVRAEAHAETGISKDDVVAALSGERVDRVKLMHTVLDDAEDALRLGDVERMTKIIFVWSQRREYLLAGEEKWEDEHI